MGGPRPTVVTLALALLLTAGCGSGSHPSGSPKPLGAAEPAVAPAPTATPAGTTVRVGDQPQGIVYDPTTDLVAVAVRKPSRLLLLDPRTLARRTSIQLPGKVRHLQLARPGGPVLAPVETANRIFEVSLPTARVRSTAVQRHPHDAAGASNGDVAVGNEFSGSLSIVRAGAVVRTFEDLKQPGGVVADGSTVAVVDVGAFTLSTYDLTRMRRTARVPLGKGPTHGVLTSGHRVVSTDTRGNQVLVDSLAPLRQVGRISLPGSPYGVASDPTTSTVWVTLTARNEVVGLDVSGSTPRVVATYPTVRQPDTVAVAPGSHTLWVTGTYDGVVQRISR